MDALQESGWEELRREARKVESDLDVKLSNYAKLGARVAQGDKRDWQVAPAKIKSGPTEFRRTKGNINSVREHAELLSSVQDDISEYKASVSGFPGTQLLRERAAIHGSISHIDDVISQAQATRAVLGSQRTLFGDVRGKIKLLGHKFPVICGVIGSISRK